MLALCWDDAERRYDLGVSNGEFAKDDSLRSLVLISVHTDRGIEPSELEEGEDDRRGWWADRYRKRKIGSRLWRLRNAKATPQNVELCRKYLDEALAWMVEDGLAERVEVEAKADGEVLRARVGIVRPGEVAPRFYESWEATRAA